MQPIDPDKTPKVHIPTLNHIGLWVDNLDNAVIELTSSNIIFTSGGIRKGACKIKTMNFILIS
jgi:lactoylglutathione lyase